VRGYGSTRFLSSETFRNGQPAALAADLIALMDALRIERAIIAGFDWGGRTGDIVAVLWHERCKALVSVSGYLIGSQEAGKAPLPPNAELQWWYQYYFATERGRAGYESIVATSRGSFGSSFSEMALRRRRSMHRRLVRECRSCQHRDP
jgi:pimeloyl-ACP methyl ester carboxylesterase